MIRRAIGFCSLAMLSLAAAGADQSASARPTVDRDFVVKHVRLFDGERVQDDMDVVVEGGVIRSVGRSNSKGPHLPVVEGKGATLIPGLIDAHVHVHALVD